MSKIEVIPATFNDVEFIAAHVREADRIELWDSSHFTPEDALLCGLECSTKVWTGWYEDIPVAMAGIVPINVLCGEALPWMVATTFVEQHVFAFMRASIKYLKEMQEAYPVLFNHVDPRNKNAVRYLRWLGFDIKPLQIMGAARVPFHRFEMRSCNV